ncbi:hypothetical protein B0I29_10177 [Actinoplanes lutulentus]|uniref:Uncharacterized protein n=1 Tax=Actinoplanes lutulentus TaxID=1287878 RepID=A0A327ZIZ7_9ACTN|nr:hypothetical protein B0I29_10177 [Actinoplanes lutulentus]
MSVVFDRPVRDIAVRDGTQTNCAGFAKILADIEPAERFEFLSNGDAAPAGVLDDELIEQCIGAVRRGVLDELTRVGDGEVPPVRFVLRRILVHLVDSAEFRNEAVGRMAVAEAVRRLNGAY